MPRAAASSTGGLSPQNPAVQRLLARLGSRSFLTVSLLLLLLLAAKDSQNLLRAEFYGEDGPAWYKQAYELGWACLTVPWAGYLNTLQRLVALASLPLPLAWAPAVFNLAAFAVQAGTLLLLVSGRMEQAWPRRGARVLLALLIVLMPAALETTGNLTNAHTNSALLCFLVLAAAAPAGKGAWLFDTAVLAIGSLSGPFCVFLLPFAAHQWWRRREPAHLLRLGLVLAGVAAQALAYLLGEPRASPPLGATLVLLFKLIALIPLEATLGARLSLKLAGTALWSAPLAIALGSATLAVFAAAWRAGPLLLRHFLLLSALLFAAALARPLVDAAQPAWPVMANSPPAGGRYYLLPLIAWYAALFALAARWPARQGRPVGLLLLCTCLLAIPADWPRWHGDAHDAFQAQAAVFEHLPPGSPWQAAIRPYGGWQLVLRKK